MMREQVILIKLDSSGKLQWQKNIGDIDEHNAAYDIQLTNEGGFVITGYCRKIQPFGTSSDGIYNQYFVMKLDSAGNLDWQKRFASAYSVMAKCIVACRDGSYVVVGDLSDDCLIIKIDSAGKEQWRKIFGGKGIDIAQRAIENSEGEILVSGVSAKNSGEGTGWLFKLDETGMLKWEGIYRGGSQNDYLNSLQLTKDGGIIAAGYCFVEDPITQNNGYNKLWVVKFKR